MAYQLPPLDYAYNALEPYIDARTMEIHHTRHHQAYIDKVNAAIKDYPELEQKSVYDLIKDLAAVPEAIRTAVRNNGGGHANHSFFWKVLSPQGGGQPSGELAQAIDRDFGSLAAFKTQFEQAAATRFGSGWAWLATDKAGRLTVYSTANQDSPLMEGLHPVIGLDVWEHAYYLQYQNKRPAYIEAFWQIVSWPQAEKNYRFRQA
ncbi:MAG: superoxide dismutase [Oscillospiraceae bacterium]|nr:superoxide dismutase [Oscillospiraceae bacterium]MDD4367325.1 superoxide dismutase [Oscillospiraceae bacterium]